MDAGLQVINESGFLQIDGRFSNYSFVQRFLLTPTSIGAYVSACDITVEGDALVFAGLVEGAAVGLSYSVRAAGSPTTRQYRFSFFGGQLPVYVFRKVAPVNVTYGLEVYGESGQLVFAGPGNKYMKVVRSYALPDYTTMAPDTLPAGRTYAVLIGRVSGEVTVTTEEIGISRYDRYENRASPHFCISGSTVYLSVQNYFSLLTSVGAPEFISHYRFDLSAVIADVTGFL